MRLIDADELKRRILEERDKIPLTIVERYSFGVGTPNRHGQSMRGGIRKALRCMEETPTANAEERKQGRWIRTDKEYEDDWSYTHLYWITCPFCGLKLNSDSTHLTASKMHYCPNCGAKLG